MKTAEKIKKGMGICSVDGDCNQCPYFEGLCVDGLMPDSLAHIQQLEQDNAQKDERIRQLERELDKAMEDLATTRNCKVCKYVTGDAHEEPCWSCGIAQRNWEWRGVEEENE